MTKSKAQDASPRPALRLEEEVFVSLSRTADFLQRQAAEAFRKFDISPTQYNALRILRGAGPEGLPCSEIGKRMINRDPDITRLVDRLLKRRLAVRTRDARDGRVIRTRISGSGLDLLTRMQPAVDKLHRKMLGKMDSNRLEQMLRLLEEVRADQAG